jgi:hypothetical protein
VGGFDGPIHVFPDDKFGKPLAGPFASGPAARLWIVEHVEKRLSAPKLAVWQQVAALLPPLTDCGLELALIGLVAHGTAFEQMTKYIPSPQRGPDRRAATTQTLLPMAERRDASVPDHRMAAAGERP